MKAFPTVNWVQQAGQPPNDEGMDLRDWFAGIALPECIGWGEPEKVCARAYIYADEMMKAREKKRENKDG